MDGRKERNGEGNPVIIIRYRHGSIPGKRPVALFALPFLLLFALSLLLGSELRAQVRDFSWYDNATFQLYEQKQWKALSETGRQALQSGYDYYYLRMRLGIAEYERERYRAAARHFRKALAFNQLDPTAREMRYYSLLYGGQYGEARQVGGTLRPEGRSPFLQILAWEAEAGLRNGPGTNPIGNLYYANTGFIHSIGGRLAFTHRYQFLVQYLRVAQEVGTPDEPGHGNGNNGSSSKDQISEPTVTQQEYYLGGTLAIGGGWQVGAGWHPLWVTDTISRYYNMASALSIRKDWTFLQLSATLGWNRLNAHEDLQYEFYATIYPLANTKLFYTGGGMVKSHPGENIDGPGFLVTQQIGFKVFKNTWLTGRYDFGEIDNFTEGTAGIIYNFPDYLTRRYGGGIQYWIGGRHLLYFLYRKEHKNRVLTQEGFRQNLFLAGLQIYL